MDPTFNKYPDFRNGSKIDNRTLLPNSNRFPILPDEYEFNQLSPPLDSIDNYLILPSDPDPGNFIPSITLSSEGEPVTTPSTAGPDGGLYTPPSSVSPGSDSSSDENDFSETVLKYISQILMEENIEEKPSMFYDPLGLQVTEKSFYDALGERYPYSPNQSHVDQRVETPDSNFSGSSSDYGGTITSTRTASSPQLLSDLGDHKPSSIQSLLLGDYNFQSNLQSGSQLSAPLTNNLGNGLPSSSVNELLAQNIFRDSDSISLFQRGLEEASKFLPKSNQLIIDLESNKFSPELKGEATKVVGDFAKGERENSPNGSRGRKREDVDAEEEKSNKQSAVYSDESELSEMFDRVLLHPEHGCRFADSEAVGNEACRALQLNNQSPGSNTNSGKGRGKKQGKKKETVDLRTLLILCAQAVSANDRRTAHELLKQIRQHSYPLGDGSQRLAHCFANGLEARLAGTGTGTQLYYTSLLSHVKATEILKAYQVNLSSCPFMKLAMFFANKMIMKVAENATTLHIVDFGILYGFQWPILIQHISKRPGGPPKLRITGIEYPQKGFRPAERIEETGRRLAKYCERFGVPFEYNAIASQNWETIRVEDIKIDSNEFVAVNCLLRFKNLLDETVEVNCPRDAILNLIRKMNPSIFVHAIANGSYNAPFFVTRFREALFHFSALFDVLDTNIARENEERLMFEREFYGRESMNVIACEGLERVERPETYKQWQVRSMRAGFRSLPLDQELMTKFRGKLKAWYHKDFVIDEDCNWMLQGWKGRIVYGSSCWVPA